MVPKDVENLHWCRELHSPWSNGNRKLSWSWDLLGLVLSRRLLSSCWVPSPINAQFWYMGISVTVHMYVMFISSYIVFQLCVDREKFTFVVLITIAFLSIHLFTSYCRIWRRMKKFYWIYYKNAVYIDHSSYCWMGLTKSGPSVLPQSNGYPRSSRIT